MNSTLKNILAVVAGIVTGSVVNMVIIMISGSVILPPEGAAVTTMEGLQESMHLFQPKHFLMPFLAHAFGTFVGAFVAAKIAAGHKMRLAITVGFFFLMGGVINVIALPSPLWFSIVDLVFAYIPVAYLAGIAVVGHSNDFGTES